MQAHKPIPGRSFAVALRSEGNAERVEVDGKVSFGGVAYSGGAIRQFGSEIAVDVAGMRVKELIPVTLNHDDGKIVGRARIENDGKSLRIVDGEFSAVTEAGREVAALMAEGHPWEFSIGASGTYVSADRKRPVKINGRELPVDAYLSKTRLLHVSFVPAGADPDAIAARLSATYATETDMSGDTQGTPNDDLDAARREVAALKTENAKLASDLAAATASLAAIRTERRDAAVTALFGADVADADRKAYREMPDVAFAAMEKAIRDERAKSDPALFRQEHGNGRAAGDNVVATAGGMPKMLDGLPVDEERLALHAKIVAYLREHPNVPYLDAAIAVEAAAR